MRKATLWEWAAATFAVVLGAIAARSILNFSHTYPPAIDAAYYPVQTRMLILHGRLMYEDLPLIFMLDAAVAKVLMAFGWAMNVALLTASRWLDCIAQPWTAAAVMAMGFTWSDGRRRALPGCAAAALLAVSSPPIMRMLSDFEKNSLGLVWMAAAVWICRAAMHGGGWSRWAALVGVMTLLALTHVGAFAVTAVMVAIALVVWQWPRWRLAPCWKAPRWQAWIGIVSLGFCAAALMGLMFTFAPRRAIAILRAPLEVLGFGGPLYWMDPLSWILLAAVYAVIWFGLRRVWHEEARLARADVAIVTAAALTAGLLVSPVFNGAYLQRLSLMAPVPAAFVLAFVMARRAIAGKSTRVAYVTLIAAVFTAVLGSRSAPASLLSEPAADELGKLRPEIAAPDSTLVVAPHGLEWWAGFFLYTPVRVDQVPPDAFLRYRRVLLLRGTNEVQVSPSGRSGLRGPLGRLWDLPIDPAAVQLYSGRFFELYELPPRNQ